LDGTDPKADWTGYIPQPHNPHANNPARGFLSSAYQSSVDPSYPYYMGWQYAPTERGRRINERLEAMSKITMDSLRGLQNDNFNIRARTLLPLLMAQLTSPKAGVHAQAAGELKRWNLQNSVNSVGATIFENWVLMLQDAIWADEFEADDQAPMSRPSMDRTIKMIQDEPNAPWWDNVKTKNKKERMAEIISGSFTASIDTLVKKHGVMGPEWAWYKHKQTGVRHLIPGMDALSRLNIPIGGGGTIVNATTMKTGPSWRMIVELSKEGKPRAHGVYPGGQSGNPGSAHYDDLIDTWAKGELRSLLYLEKPEDVSGRLRKKIVLSTKK
jgi:penicillin amidase